MGGERGYEKRWRGVPEVFNARPFPGGVPNPSGDTLLLATPVPYPPIADLAKPMLRLAGLRIDPTTNGEHHAPFWTALSLKKIPDGSGKRNTLPPNPRPSHLPSSPAAKSIPFATPH